MKNDKKKLIEFARGYDLTPRMSKKPEDYDDAESLWKSLDIHLRTVYSFLSPTLDELRPYMRSSYGGQGYIPLPAPSVKIVPEEEPAPEVIEKRPVRAPEVIEQRHVRVTRSKSKKVAL